MSKVYKGDIGTSIILDCGSDVSTASAQEIKVQKPQGSTTTWSATVYNTNYLKHTTISTSVDDVGRYRLQAYVELTEWQGRGETADLTVYDYFG